MTTIISISVKPRLSLLKTEIIELKEKNVDLLQSILDLRTRIAGILGYATWADYQTEINMAGNGETALNFLKELKEGLQPKFDAELEAFRQLKVEETGDADAKIHLWDWRYYSNLLKKKKKGDGIKPIAFLF